MMTSLVACYKPLSNPTLRLFCLHHAGGGASSYRSWQPYFESLNVEIVPIQLPGRENRISESFVTDVPDLITSMLQELQPLLDRPFALWGHSMGALLGFEFGVRLQAERRTSPICLFASAKAAPQLMDKSARTTILSDDEFIESVKRFGGFPEAVLADSEMLDLVLPALRADFELCEQYQYKETQRLECPIFCYGGIQDKTVDQHSLLAWESLTSNTFTLRRFPGDHFYVQSQSALLMKALMQDLAQQISEI